MIRRGNWRTVCSQCRLSAPGRRLYGPENTENRDLVLSVLRSTATKREAKQYISKYTPRVTHPFSVLERQYEALSILEGDEVLRIALLKIREIKSIDAVTLHGIGATISRLVKLGVSPVVVVDAGKERHDFLHLDNEPFRHYQRNIIWKAGLVASAIEEASPAMRARPIESVLETKQAVEVAYPDMIMKPLIRGVVPVVAPVAYDPANGEEKLVQADDVVLALTKHFAEMENCSIEKVIFVDPLGGIPSVERGGTSHVYVNLEQELSDITAELHIPFIPAKTREIQLANLQAMNRALGMLPITATGIITTPQGAAFPSTSKNPIIYNVLTDRPVVSPSLPVDNRKTPVVETTIVRKGMPVQIIRSEGPSKGIDLMKKHKIGAIDLNRLRDLINDSFGKEIDMMHYLNRINNKVAGIIIAGDYEGAAIITWEGGENGTPAVPYLDKFAVCRSSQGASGVADIVFKAMLMQLFPQEIVWRSRKTNPVNKWYFERSKGTLKLPNSNWTMFWAGLRTREQTSFSDYLNVCSSIPSSFKQDLSS
ncbi:amino-acid acetyltransferase, mitochondrial [Trichomonascus vanleenenianus]|uniref:acetyl-CoA:L-glutamate N-acetyltransferase n=1 Tax=Trichomonascus vanleenenianus TaxID=2268995 RepID=UPI003ECA1F2F